MVNVKVGDLLVPKLRDGKLVNGHRMYPTPKDAFHLNSKGTHTHVPAVTDRLLVVAVEPHVFENYTMTFVKLQNMSALTQEGWVEGYGTFDVLWDLIARADNE